MVFRGKRSGLYNSWCECAPMVIGVKGSIFKSFKCYDDAILAFNDFQKNDQAKNKSKSKVYVVFRGKRPGLYNSWRECAPMVLGFKGSIYQAFNSYDEANEALREYKKDNIGHKDHCSSSFVDESNVVLESDNESNDISSGFLAGMFVGLKISS